jgi:hypothetical protein
MVENVFFDESTEPSVKSFRAELGEFYNNFKDLWIFQIPF